MLLFDSSLTLVNGVGTSTAFTFGYTHDTEVPNGHHSFNDHESVDALRADVEALLTVVDEWGRATLNALYDFREAAQD